MQQCPGFTPSTLLVHATTTWMQQSFPSPLKDTNDKNVCSWRKQNSFLGRLFWQTHFSSHSCHSFRSRFLLCHALVASLLSSQTLSGRPLSLSLDLCKNLVVHQVFRSKNSERLRRQKLANYTTVFEKFLPVGLRSLMMRVPRPTRLPRSVSIMGRLLWYQMTVGFGWPLITHLNLIVEPIVFCT